jgi:hypothetical protein
MGDRVADLRMIGVAVQGAGCRALCEAVIFNVGNWGRRDPGGVVDTRVTRFRPAC